MTNSVSTSTMRTAAVPNPRAIMVGSGDFTNWKIASGSETIGESRGLTFRAAVNPEVNRTGEVSPTPRAVARMMEVVSPERDVGRTTFHTVFHWDAPRPMEASLSVCGTRRNTTSAERIMMGSIMTLIAREAANPDFGTPNIKMAVAKMNRPATMEGRAVIASTMVRTKREKRPGISLRYTAAAIPSGIVMTSAMVI